MHTSLHRLAVLAGLSQEAYSHRKWQSLRSMKAGMAYHYEHWIHWLHHKCIFRPIMNTDSGSTWTPFPGVFQGSCRFLCCPAFIFRIERHHTYWCPVPCFTRPAFRMLASCGFIDCFPLFKQGLIQTLVPLFWCDKLNPAMTMLGVVPAYEAVYPCPCFAYIAKAIGRPCRAIFQCSEQRLRVGVIIADPGSTEWRADTQFIHFGQHCEALHRSPVIWV